MLCNHLTIRASRKSDLPAIAIIQETAFGRLGEARLTLDLIASSNKTISLLAECDGKLIGHVLFTEIDAPLSALALAPLAVLPDFRELQVGTALVKAGLDRARRSGYEAVFVLGDRGYYERFGFKSEKADSFKIAWQGPHFMGLELKDGALARRKGRLIYPDVFGEV